MYSLIKELFLIYLGKRRFNVKIWRKFCDVFKHLPIVGLIDDKIICMHGGISPDL